MLVIIFVVATWFENVYATIVSDTGHKNIVRNPRNMHEQGIKYRHWTYTTKLNATHS